MPHIRSVSIGFWVGVGSRHETDAQAGISHFIEHLLFKGTERRTAREIAEAIDAVGGTLNAFTGKESTCFYARTLDEHFPLAVDLLTDMLRHPRFDAGDMDRERGVIIEEILMYEDTPDELVHDIFSQTLWPDHPLGRAIQGTVDSVKDISRDDVLAYYGAHYRPENIVVAVAGNVSHERVVEEIARRFDEPAGAAPALALPVPRPAATQAYRAKDIEQVHICVGSEGLPLGHDRIYSLHLMSNILGGGSSSRLFQEIREERGLAYSVYAFHSAYRDAGLAAIYLAANPASAAGALDLVRAELDRIREHGVSAEELRRNKEQLKGNLLLGMESTSNRMSHLGKGELLRGHIQTPAEIIRRIEAVTPEDVRNLAREIWVGDRLSLAAVGPAAFREVIERAAI